MSGKNKHGENARANTRFRDANFFMPNTYMQRRAREEETSTRVLGLNPRPVYEKTEGLYAVPSYFFWTKRILPLPTPTRKNT